MFGMIMHHTIMNNFLYGTIRCELYQSCQGGFYPLFLRFSFKRKSSNLTIISFEKMSQTIRKSLQNWEKWHFSDFSRMHQSRDTKQSITTEFLLSMYSSLLLYISKALIQVPRNIEDHVIAHFALYFVFFFKCAIHLVQREPSKLAISILWPNYWEEHKNPPPPPPPPPLPSQDHLRWSIVAGLIV